MTATLMWWKIMTSFFTNPKHGIYRDILTRYEVEAFDGSEEKREIKISNIEVPGYKFVTTNAFMRKVGGTLRIKIGDEDITVRGELHYEIKYRVKHAFLHEPDADRFYWNLKPTDWYAQFQDMTFRIHLPEKGFVDGHDFQVYSGAIGSTEVTRDFSVQQADGVLTGTAVEGFTSNYGDAVTILIDLPPGSIKEYKPLWPFWTKYGWGLIAGVLITLFYGLWRKYGKDDRVPTTISYHAPEGLDSAMAGFLIDDKDDTADLISLIPYWGARGYLRIEEIEDKGWFSKGDTKLIKIKHLSDDAPDYQKTIFIGLFGNWEDSDVLISSLKNTFYTDMNLAKSQLKAAAQKYYEPKANAVMKMTYGVLVVLLLLLTPLSLYLWGFIGAIVVFLTFAFLLIMNRYMIKKNQHGNRVFF